MTSSYPQFIRCGSKVFPLSAVQLVRYDQQVNGKTNIRISILDVADVYFEGAEAERLWAFFCRKASIDFGTPTSVEVSGISA
jgi:hypothetical protein